MLEAVGRAVGTLLAIALGAEALLTLRPLRVRLNTRTLAWRYVAPILAVLVLAQVSPAMRLAHRAGDAAVAAVASADLLAVGQITLLTLVSLTLVSLTLTRTLRTFGSELHGQWRAEEGIETFSAGVGIGLRFDVDLRFSFCARSCTRQVIKRRRASPGQW